MEQLENWSEYYRIRKQIRNRCGSIWKIPLVKRELPMILERITDGSRVLEIGASHIQRYRPGVKEAMPSVEYLSMDIDRSTEQDFYGLDEITGSYDLVLVFEVLEHMELGESLKLLKKAYEVTKQGGGILTSTPNLFHPHRFWDSTHKTPLRYEELGALLTMAGYDDIEVYRKHTEPFVKKLIRRTVMMPIHRYMDVDFAKTVIVGGKRRGA